MLPPGTIGSGLIVDMVIAAMNRAYVARIDPLSDQDILGYAGIPTPEIPPSPSPTYFDVSRFVLV